MLHHWISEQIQSVAQKLTMEECSEYQFVPPHKALSPSIPVLGEVMGLLRRVVFPGFFDPQSPSDEDDPLGRTVFCLQQLYDKLQGQIHNGLCFGEENSRPSLEQAANITVAFIDQIPEIRRLLTTDVKAILDGDPAANSAAEVIFSYPAALAMLHQRAAHCLWLLEVPVIPRILTEMAHSLTGIDIHPAAQIGEHFSIDHGTGVVIGETTVIGHHVRLYQGVTLGAKSFTLNNLGQPINHPRHPIIEDYVTIYSNASVLGRITIGHHSVIGGNIWLTRSVPPHSKVVQTRAKNQ